VPARLGARLGPSRFLPGFPRGSYLGFVVAERIKPLTTADVRKLARLAAKRLDAGFG